MQVHGRTIFAFGLALTLHATGTAVLYSCGPAGLLRLQIMCAAVSSHLYAFVVFPICGFLAGSSIASHYFAKTAMLGVLMAAINGIGNLIAQRLGIPVDIVTARGSMILVFMWLVLSVPLTTLGGVLGHLASRFFREYTRPGRPSAHDR